MLRAASGMIIVTAALCATSAHAQSDRSGDQRPTVSRSLTVPKGLPTPEDWRGSENYFFRTAIEKAIYRNLELLQKHLQVARMQSSLQKVVGFPRTLRFEQAHRVWLDERVQCAGPDCIDCLHRLYDARIQELAHSIATEEPSTP
jgi:hypothetical protein